MIDLVYQSRLERDGAGELIRSGEALTQHIRPEPFILPPRDAVPVFHDAVLKACREAGFVPHAHEADHLHLVLGMVAAGAGTALVPAAARKINQSRVVYRALRPSPDNLETAMAWRRGDTSQTLAEFISAARRTLSRRRR